MPAHLEVLVDKSIPWSTEPSKEEKKKMFDKSSHRKPTPPRGDVSQHPRPPPRQPERTLETSSETTSERPSETTSDYASEATSEAKQDLLLGIGDWTEKVFAEAVWGKPTHGGKRGPASSAVQTSRPGRPSRGHQCTTGDETGDRYQGRTGAGKCPTGVVSGGRAMRAAAPCSELHVRSGE